MPISAADQAVLAKMLDPEAAPSKAEPLVTDLPVHGYTTEQCEPLRSTTKQLLVRLELEQSLADLNKSQLETLASLTAMIEANPGYYPALVDRAMVTRMSIPLEKLLTKDSEAPVATIIKDLSNAIRLASPSPTERTLLRQQRTALASAYTHRGLLLLRASKLLLQGQEVFGMEQVLASDDVEAAESLANNDFRQGARYGNDVAEQLAVKTNPYAKMCGQIVQEALRKEREGGFGDELVSASLGA